MLGIDIQVLYSSQHNRHSTILLTNVVLDGISTIGNSVYTKRCCLMSMQDVVLPKEHCDDRVEILQADARELDVRELFTKSEVCV